MIEIGKMNRMVVSRETKSGYYLISTEVDPDDYYDEGEVFMPPSMGPYKVKNGPRDQCFCL